MKITKLFASSLIFFNLLNAASATPLVLLGSTDGMWSQASTREMTPPVNLLVAASKANGYLAVGVYYSDLLLLAESTDRGQSWHSLSGSYDSFKPLSFAANSNGFVVGGSDNFNFMRSIFSANGTSWQSARQLDSFEINMASISSIAANETVFVGIGSSKAYRNGKYEMSPMIATLNPLDAKPGWKIVKTLPLEIKAPNAALQHIQWAQNKWVASGITANQQLTFFTSVDLVNWSVWPLAVEAKEITSMAIKDNSWVAIITSKEGSSYSLIKSVDSGKTWTSVSVPSYPVIRLNKIYYNADHWALVGAAGDDVNHLLPLILTSADGSNWQKANLPIRVMSYSKISAINDIYWDGSQWVALGTYDQNKIGCKTLNDVNWSGSLQNININTLAFATHKQISDNQFELNGYIDYKGNEGGTFGFGPFEGTCVEQSDGSINMDLTFIYTDYGQRQNYSMHATKASFTSNQINITSSCLPDEHRTCGNFSGTLNIKK